MEDHAHILFCKTNLRKSHSNRSTLAPPGFAAFVQGWNASGQDEDLKRVTVDDRHSIDFGAFSIRVARLPP